MKKSVLCAVWVVAFGVWCLTGYGQGTPVGLWEAAISGDDKGLAYIEFDADGTFTGYGIAVRSFDLFSFDGTWAVDASGNLTGVFSEDIFGSTLYGTIAGKVKTGSSIKATAYREDGAVFKFKGRMATSVPNISGHWNTLINQGGYGGTAGEIDIMAVPGAPGLFEFSGTPTVSGLIVLDSRGRGYGFAASDDLVGFSAKFSLLKGKGSIKGVSLSGGTFSGSLTK